jgi:imidazolonepropionase-like amidohydrolase
MSRFITYALILNMCSWNLCASELLIKGAKIYTLSGEGILENSDIYIRDGRIEEISAGLQAGPGVDLIDARGMQLTPGLINVDSALGIVEINAVEDTVDVRTKDNMFSASYNVSVAFNPSSTVIPHNQIHGLTLVIIRPSNGNNVFAGQGAAIHLVKNDAHLINESVALYARYDSRAGEYAGGSRAAAYLKLRMALTDTQEFIQNRAAILHGEWRELSLPIHDLEALVPVLQDNKPFVITSHRASDISNLIQLKREFGLNMVISGASEAWMVGEKLAEEGIPVIIDPLENLPSNFDRLGARLDAAAMLQRAGVKVLFTNYSTQPTHNPYLIRISAGNAVSYGMPAIEAIKAMTLYPAEVFGFSDQYGTIEVGKMADLVIWDGDPLELLTGASTVIINGEVVPMVSRSTRLRDRYRDLDSSVPFIFRK